MSKATMRVTQPSLPPLEEFMPYLAEIWQSKVLTNGGRFHQELEHALCEYLGVPFISLFSNGTNALITALKVLDIKGEVITTPYSFVATSHSLMWNGVRPVFVDIDPVTLNLDPSKIEAAITPETTGILPVHVYGHPCDVDAIDTIAKKHALKVIYDAAHAFGVTCHCGSLLSHGDLSVLSFHATKVFNTFEGGAIVCKNAEIKRHIDQLKNFGFSNETAVTQIGINGKMNEFSASLGLLQLKHVDKEMGKRKLVDNLYRAELKETHGIRCHIEPKNGMGNYGYFPVFIEKQYPHTRDEIYRKLRSKGIHARRYFYPLITQFQVYKQEADSQNHALVNAELASSQVLCLPIHTGLSEKDILEVTSIIKGV